MSGLKVASLNDFITFPLEAFLLSILSTRVAESPWHPFFSVDWIHVGFYKGRCYLVPDIQSAPLMFAHQV